MSHFTKINTKITDLECLKLTLDDLGYTYREGGVRVKGWRGLSEEAELVVETGSPYTIGLRKTAQGGYEIVADWWGVETRTGIVQSKFLKELNQRYAYNKVLSEVRKQGFSVAEDEVASDNTIRLVVRKWS